MAGTCTFNVGEVRRLFEHSKNAATHQASYEHLCNPEYHKDGIILTESGEQYREDVEGHWPSSKNLDETKIPACLWLVGDDGIYLMSNGSPRQLASEGSERSLVAYAAEANPKTDPEGVWNAKQRIFGGDDGVDALPLSMFEYAMQLPDSATFKVKISSEKVEVVVPQKRITLKQGMKLKFDPPLKFMSGGEYSMFVLVDPVAGHMHAVDESGNTVSKCKVKDIRGYIRAGLASIQS